jgi:hypothetical protein
MLIAPSQRRERSEDRNPEEYQVLPIFIYLKRILSSNMPLKQEHAYLWVHNMIDGLDRVLSCIYLARRKGELDDRCKELIEIQNTLHLDLLDRIIRFELSLPEGYSMERMKKLYQEANFPWEANLEKTESYIKSFCGRT